MNSFLCKPAAIRNNLNLIAKIGSRAMSGGADGSGVGHGGGTGGAIRDAGGAFGKMEAAQEELYIRKLQNEQLKNLKKSLQSEMKFHEKQIDAHKEAMERHKDRLEEMEEITKHK